MVDSSAATKPTHVLRPVGGPDLVLEGWAPPGPAHHRTHSSRRAGSSRGSRRPRLPLAQRQHGQRLLKSGVTGHNTELTGSSIAWRAVTTCGKEHNLNAGFRGAGSAALGLLSGRKSALPSAGPASPVQHPGSCSSCGPPGPSLGRRGHCLHPPAFALKGGQDALSPGVLGVCERQGNLKAKNRALSQVTQARLNEPLGAERAGQAAPVTTAHTALGTGE